MNHTKDEVEKEEDRRDRHIRDHFGCSTQARIAWGVGWTSIGDLDFVNCALSKLGSELLTGDEL